MKKRWYKIMGVSMDMLEAWQEDLREDILVWVKNDEVSLRIRLTWFQAICMRLSMMKINLSNPISLRLERD